MLLSICQDIWKLCALQPNAGFECKYSSTNLPFGVQVHPLFSVLSLGCSFPLCFVPFASPLSVLFKRAFSSLCLSESVKDHALLYSSLWAGVCCCGVSFSHLRAQAAELQPRAHSRSSAKHAHKCFVVFFPHEDFRKYARKLNVSNGEMTPKRHLNSLCQSRRDRFSF